MSTPYAQRNRVSRRFPRQKNKSSGESATATNNIFQEINDGLTALNEKLNEKHQSEDNIDRKKIIDSLNNATRSMLPFEQLSSQWVNDMTEKSKTSKTRGHYEPTIGEIGEGKEIERAFRAPNAVRLIRLFRINYRKLRSQFRDALIVIDVRKELYNDHLQSDPDDGHGKWADTTRDWKLRINVNNFLSPFLRGVWDDSSILIDALSEAGVQLETAHFQDSMHRFRDELTKFTVIHYNRLSARYRFPEDGTITMNAHIDLTLEPLANALEDVLKELTDITEQVIQRSEQYSNQRYLNLTTIATFLSSVTATTLQISTSGPDSVLAGVTNEFWFISLVFSMASATQSLIIMIWRQSFRRQPQEVFPSAVWKWFRNGPIYSLAIAMISFFVALCLLAFLVHLPGKGAAVPATLIFIYACLILSIPVPFKFPNIFTTVLCLRWWKNKLKCWCHWLIQSILMRPHAASPQSELNTIELGQHNLQRHNSEEIQRSELSSSGKERSIVGEVETMNDSPNIEFLALAHRQSESAVPANTPEITESGDMLAVPSVASADKDVLE